MKLAFCLYHYFPFGGLQRDFIHIAEACAARGHEIHVWTSNWEGPLPTAFQLHVISVQGLTNHARMKYFAKATLADISQHAMDGIIGFNKMPGLNIYYAADVCLKARMANRPYWQQLLPRYRQYQKIEQMLFTDNRSQIIYISPSEKNKYQYHYHTPDQRLHWLGPGLSQDRIYPENAALIRKQIRLQWEVAENELMLLMVGSGFQTKGLDRTIKAIHALPAPLRERTKLFVIGKGDCKPFLKLVKECQLSQQIHILGTRCDVPEFLLSADLLLQPSYTENTGTAIIEAMNAGCPVLASGVCGYAALIIEAGAGLVSEEPFSQPRFNRQLQYMLESPEEQRSHWAKQGRRFAEGMDLFSFPSRAAHLIERLLNH